MHHVERSHAAARRIEPVNMDGHVGAGSVIPRTIYLSAAGPSINHAQPTWGEVIGKPTNMCNLDGAAPKGVTHSTILVNLPSSNCDRSILATFKVPFYRSIELIRLSL